MVWSHLFEDALVYNIFYLRSTLLYFVTVNYSPLPNVTDVACTLHRLCVAVSTLLRLRVVAGDMFPVRP